MLALQSVSCDLSMHQCFFEYVIYIEHVTGEVDLRIWETGKPECNRRSRPKRKQKSKSFA